jgi:hypothetical protein
MVWRGAGRKWGGQVGVQARDDRDGILVFLKVPMEERRVN